jgi:hypothetical protein
MNRGDERAGALRRAQGWTEVLRLYPDRSPLAKRKAWCSLPHRKSGLPDLRTHKKTDPGQAGDRHAIRDFQFHESTDLRSCVKHAAIKARTQRRCADA